MKNDPALIEHRFHVLLETFVPLLSEVDISSVRMLAGTGSTDAAFIELLRTILNSKLGLAPSVLGFLKEVVEEVGAEADIGELESRSSKNGTALSSLNLEKIKRTFKRFETRLGKDYVDHTFEYAYHGETHLAIEFFLDKIYTVELPITRAEYNALSALVTKDPNWRDLTNIKYLITD